MKKWFSVSMCVNEKLLMFWVSLPRYPRGRPKSLAAAQAGPWLIRTAAAAEMEAWSRTRPFLLLHLVSTL